MTRFRRTTRQRTDRVTERMGGAVIQPRCLFHVWPDLGSALEEVFAVFSRKTIICPRRPFDILQQESG